jgi:hypothetical protein
VFLQRRDISHSVSDLVSKIRRRKFFFVDESGAALRRLGKGTGFKLCVGFRHGDFYQLPVEAVYNQPEVSSYG